MKRKILLGITGSVAAYKSIDLAKSLLEKGLEVEIVLSKSACEFLSVLTLRSLFPGRVHIAEKDLGVNDEMLHITLAKNSDLILIAPASANFLSALASGRADCLLSTLCLATKAPITVAPAMNTIMWSNKFVQKNVQTLKSYGIKMIGPDVGSQACGDFGPGRMLEVNKIVANVQAHFTAKILSGKRIVINAGPTYEPIDPVRFLSNYSSGKMGYAIATVAAGMGAKVILISGPTSLEEPILDNIKLIRVKTALEMLGACTDAAADCDVFIGAAAISDYRPESYCQQKVKKSVDSISLNLIKNPDIIAHIKKRFPGLYCVGFVAETQGFEEYGRKKLEEKQLDMVAINDVSGGKGFSSNYNELYVITKGGKSFNLPEDTKENIAASLLKLIRDFAE